MKNYRVRIVRAAMETATVNVSAKDEEEARCIAIEHEGVVTWTRRGDASRVAVEAIEEVD
jgi:hypothetical protein